MRGWGTTITRFWTAATTPAVAIAIASCATVHAPAPVSGSRADLAQLTGQWSGEYHNASSGRQGSILFQLSADADTAYGDVLMFPRLEVRGSRGDGGPARERVPQNLTIHFVRAAEGRVTGRLDPYRDADCDCIVNTLFEGRVSGDRITGTYTSSRLSDGTQQQGEWSVRHRSE